MIVFGIDISSFVNKVFHSVHMASFNCYMQVSHLKEKNKEKPTHTANFKRKSVKGNKKLDDIQANY